MTKTKEIFDVDYTINDRCGLVAVAMAAPLVGAQGVTTEQLLDKAVHYGYTKQGEMFSGKGPASMT